MLFSDWSSAVCSSDLQFGEVLNSVGEKGEPHLLCAYLYDLAGLFSSFYEHCPILSAEQPEQKQRRLRLAALTGKTPKQGLEPHGLETLRPEERGVGTEWASRCGYGRPR